MCLFATMSITILQISGLLTTVTAACKPVFEMLRIDPIKGRSQQNANHLGTGW
jgi:spore maturation protein SpmB